MPDGAMIGLNPAISSSAPPNISCEPQSDDMGVKTVDSKGQIVAIYQSRRETHIALQSQSRHPTVGSVASRES